MLFQFTWVYKGLFDDSEFFTVDPTKVFTFDPDNYPTSSPLKDSPFKKHYYKLVDKMNNEEFKFASYIDQLDEVEFWVRNLDRDPVNAFWLQTSSDKFYPDFIIKLKTEKILVVEWKGDHLKNPDSLEKEHLGLAWAGLSNSLGFTMIYSSDNMEAKLAKIL